MREKKAGHCGLPEKEKMEPETVIVSCGWHVCPVNAKQTWWVLMLLHNSQHGRLGYCLLPAVPSDTCIIVKLYKNIAFIRLFLVSKIRCIFSD